jgi:hypothetical protein
LLLFFSHKNFAREKINETSPLQTGNLKNQTMAEQVHPPECKARKGNGFNFSVVVSLKDYVARQMVNLVDCNYYLLYF